MNNHFGQSRIFRHVRFAVEPSAGEDGSIDTDVSGGGSASEDKTDDDGETIESLRQALATAKGDLERYKNSITRLNKEKSDLTKKNREMMSADQLEKEAQEERERRFAEMEKELRANKYSKRLVGLGMEEKDADVFAMTIPDLEDADSFFNTLADFIKAREKNASDKAIQDLLKSRPDINAGTGDSTKDDPAMSYAKAAVEAQKKNGAMASVDILKNYI